MQAGALSRREVEVTVSDFDTTKELLEALGYEVAFVYEKLRTTFKFDGLEIVLDELPYGHFVEIEGEGHALKATADRLGLNWEHVIRDSYSKLFEHLCSSRKLEQRDLTFDGLRGFQVSAQDLGVEPADAG
jgi:adenylate cyclase class 2